MNGEEVVTEASAPNAVDEQASERVQTGRVVPQKLLKISSMLNRSPIPPLTYYVTNGFDVTKPGIASI